jgi:hypothetical protein
VTILGCPNKYCASVVRLAKLADLFEKGLPPVAGGALDQSAWFIDAVQVLAADEAEMRRNK